MFIFTLLPNKRLCPAADRIMLGGMPGSPEPQPYGGRGGKEGGKDGNKEGHLRLGGSPPALAPQRSPSVQVGSRIPSICSD